MVFCPLKYIFFNLCIALVITDKFSETIHFSSNYNIDLNFNALHHMHKIQWKAEIECTLQYAQKCLKYANGLGA